ncbi:MAG TPA: hypothetical protein VJS37_11400 [Terriglobales bacterium]|nr:hypothetical protein [Terriglobales bacterium]
MADLAGPVRNGPVLSAAQAHGSQALSNDGGPSLFAIATYKLKLLRFDAHLVLMANAGTVLSLKNPWNESSIKRVRHGTRLSSRNDVEPFSKEVTECYDAPSQAN